MVRLRGEVAVSAEANLVRLQGTRVLLPPELIAGLNVHVTLDSSDQRVESKYAALRNAVELVGRRVPNAFLGLNTLPVYFGADVNCEACWSPEGLGGRRSLFLGDRMMFQVNRVMAGQNRIGGMGQLGPRGVPDQLYDDQRRSHWNVVRWWLAIKREYQSTKASAKATAVVVHEIGHLLHEHRAEIAFWNSRRRNAPAVPARLAQQVSSYVGNRNYSEFVAEVFTGLVHGKHYSRGVLDEYEQHGGPRVR